MRVELHIADETTLCTAADPDPCPGKNTSKIINIVPAGVVRCQVDSFISCGYGHIHDIYVRTLSLDQEGGSPGIVAAESIAGNIQLYDGQSPESRIFPELDQRWTLFPFLSAGIGGEDGCTATHRMMLHIP